MEGNNQLYFQQASKLFEKHAFPQFYNSREYQHIDFDKDDILLQCDRIFKAYSSSLEFSRISSIGKNLERLINIRTIK